MTRQIYTLRRGLSRGKMFFNGLRFKVQGSRFKVQGERRRKKGEKEKRRKE